MRLINAKKTKKNKEVEKGRKETENKMQLYIILLFFLFRARLHKVDNKSKELQSVRDRHGLK